MRAGTGTGTGIGTRIDRRVGARESPGRRERLSMLIIIAILMSIVTSSSLVARVV